MLRKNKWWWVAVFLGALALGSLTASYGAKPAKKDKIEPVAVSEDVITGSKLSIEQIEQFLLNAKVKKFKGTSKGITGSLRATLSDGKMTHEAHITTINEEKARFESNRGVELNFRDTYLFDIGGWRVARLLGLVNMVPVSVARNHQGKSAAFTWWVDNVLMDEETHRKKKVDPPDVEAFNNQMYIVHVFDQLIYNTDRNLGNLLIDKNWHIWMIDHTRAFRLHATLENAKNLKKCDRVLLENLKALNESRLTEVLKGFVRPGEIRGLLARRDLIVKFYEKDHPETIYDWLKKP